MKWTDKMLCHIELWIHGIIWTFAIGTSIALLPLQQYNQIGQVYVGEPRMKKKKKKKNRWFGVVYNFSLTDTFPIFLFRFVFWVNLTGVGSLVILPIVGIVHTFLILMYRVNEATTHGCTVSLPFTVRSGCV
jgi:hypothetical protein